MKYLINADYRVTMKGKAVVASEKANDSVYDTDEDTLTTAQMKEIAKANNFRMKGKTAAALKESLDGELENLDLAEKSEMTLSEKVKVIVQEGTDDEKTEDEILIEIVQSGVKFQKAGKLMQNAMIDLGLMLSAKDRYAKSKSIMEDKEFEPEDFDDVAAMAKVLAKKVAATSENQAIMQIKKYCKENEIDMPTKPKTAKVPMVISLIFWISQNPEASDSEMEDWLEEKEVGEKLAAAWLKKFGMVRKMAKVARLEEGEEEEEEEEE